MKQLYSILFVVMLMLPTHGLTMEIEGVTIPESVQLENRNLNLNGAGIRTKLFFDIYIGALYLEQKSSDAKEIINSNGTKRIVMHFLYDEVSREKLINGWNEGFEKNQSKEQMGLLRERLDQFNALFATAYKDNRIIFDLLSDGLSKVQINGTDTGQIAGADFQQALLAVWLGKKPADKGLKQSLLGH